MIIFIAPRWEGDQPTERKIKKVDYGFDNFIEIFSDGDEMKISKKEVIEIIEKYAPNYMQEYFPDYYESISKNRNDHAVINEERRKMRIYGF
jgi:hypothetical protein